MSSRRATAATAATTATAPNAPTAPTQDHRPGGPTDEGHPRKWLILCVLAAVAFMAQLDLFIVNVAVPAMGRSFHGAGLSDLSWVLNAYSIVFAALLVPAGRLADHFGRRRFLLAGLVIFTLASVLGALAPTLRVVVIGVWGGGAAVAASARPPIGGLLVAVDWRWIFLVNLPIGIAAVIGGMI